MTLTWGFRPLVVTGEIAFGPQLDAGCRASPDALLHMSPGQSLSAGLDCMSPEGLHRQVSHQRLVHSKRYRLERSSLQDEGQKSGISPTRCPDVCTHAGLRPHVSPLWGLSGEAFLEEDALRDWSRAGYGAGDRSIPQPEPLSNLVLDWNAVGDGVTDDTQVGFP